MPKRFLSVVFVLLVSILSFSFSQNDVLERFERYTIDYRSETPESNKVRRLIEDLDYLSIYRLYKLQMVGSIEKKESSTTTADLLTRHLESMPSEYFENTDDRIAYSAFLAWVLADLSGKAFQVGTLNEMPAYLSTFNTFTTRVRSMAETVYREWVAYSLGLVKVEPSFYPVSSLKKTDSFIGFNLKVDAPAEEEEEILSLSNERILQLLNETIALLSNKEYDVSTLVEEEVRRFSLQAAMDIAQIGDASLMTAARDLFQLWLYRSMDLIDSAPYYPAEIPIKAVNVQGFASSIILENEEFERLAVALEDNPGLKTTVVEKLKLAAQLLSVKEFTPVGLIEKDINDEVRKIVPVQTSLLGQIRNRLSAELVSKSSGNTEMWWLRFPAYIVLILLVLFLMPGIKRHLIGIVITLETSYMLFVSDITKNLLDLSLYSMFILPVFAAILIISVFSLLNWKKRTRSMILKLAILLLIAILPFVPLFEDVNEIAMDNLDGFYDSIYYSSLKNDLYMASESLIGLQLREMNSVISSELNSFKRVLRVVLTNRMNSFASNAELTYSIDANGRLRLTAPAFSQYMSIDNQPTYAGEIRGLVRDLNSFIRDSDRNSKRYQGALQSFITSAGKIMTYAGEILRKDFNSFVENSLSQKKETEIAFDEYTKSMVDILAREPLSVVIRAFRVPSFAALLLGLFLLPVIIMLVRKHFISWIYLAIMVVYSLYALSESGNLSIFVQAGSPLLRINIEPSVNVLFLIVLTGIIVLSVLWILLSQRKGSVSE